MISLETLALFSFTSFVLIITPGPNLIYIITRSLSQGRAAGLLSALGVDTGTLVHVAAASLGISALLASSALAFNLVRYAGALYLIYLGVRTWLSPGQAPELAQSAIATQSRIFWQGILTNVLNPKVALFFLAFLPQFVDPARDHVAFQILLLGLIFTLIGVSVDVMVALLASSFGRWLQQKSRVQRVQKWLAGGVYITLGLGVALGKSNQ